MPMTLTAAVPSPVARPARPAPGPARAHRVVAIELRETPGALARIVGLLLRRRCTVTRLDFAAADRHRPGRLVVGYDAPPDHADRTVERLRGLVDVLDVAVVSAAGRPG